jgi:hypothetical protein
MSILTKVVFRLAVEALKRAGVLMNEFESKGYQILSWSGHEAKTALISRQGFEYIKVSGELLMSVHKCFDEKDGHRMRITDVLQALGNVIIKQVYLVTMLV